MGTVRPHTTVVLAAITAAACACTEASPVMIGDRPFEDPAGVFVPSSCERPFFAVVLATGGADCEPVTNVMRSRDRVIVELHQPGQTGNELTPEPGEFPVNAASDQRGARVLRHVAATSSGAAGAVEEGVSGSVFVEIAAPQIMRLRLDVALASGVAVTGTIEAGNCNGQFGGFGPVPMPAPPKQLKILTLDPNAIFIEGGEVLTLETENGCDVKAMSVKVGAVPIPVVQSPGPNRFTFTAPASPNRDAPLTVAVLVRCSEGPTPCLPFQPGHESAETSLTFNPDLEPQPILKVYTPVSVTGASQISLDSSMKVTFSRAIDRTTVTASTFEIDGVTGHHSFTDGDDVIGYKTVAFTPDAPLEPDRDYTCLVTNGVKSKLKGKVLKPGVTPLATADHDAWTFHTVCDGCGSP